MIHWRTYRIIVTGERDWSDENAVRAELDGILGAYARESRPKAPLAIVHGDCSTGADAIAKEWAIEKAAAGVKHEPHPYRRELGRAGGPIRNREMATLGADLFIAFYSGKRTRGSGTLDCLAQCAAHGIPGWVIPRRRA